MNFNLTATAKNLNATANAVSVVAVMGMGRRVVGMGVSKIHGSRMKRSLFYWKKQNKSKT